MANKPFNTRIQLKHDTEEHWILATGFSPKAGELIIYDVDATHSSPRFKVGDGTTNVNELPFSENLVTYSENGLMLSEDKIKLDKANIYNEINFSSIASFNDAVAANALNTTISIEPMQSGSGDPSPTNVRPITGWTGANVTVNEDVLNITFPASAGTVYGGTLDVTTGLLTVTMAEVDLGTLTWGIYKSRMYARLADVKMDTMNVVCSMYSVSTAHSFDVEDKMITIQNEDTIVIVYDSAYTVPATFKAAMSGVQLVYELATPQTYQLTPTQIALLAGENNVWADCGDIAVKYLRDDSLGISKILNSQTFTETDPTVPAWAKATTKPTYTAQEVGALPSSTVIPTKTSDLTNDSGFLTAHQDISGKADKSATVSNVTYDTTNKKITKTINGTTSDVVSAATLKTDMSLSNVDNKSSATIRSEITSSNVTTALGFTPLNASLKGANNGIAELDSNGKVPSSQLPSYVDDVLEYIAKTGFPPTGETGKIYVDTTTNKTYRWSGSDYVEISASLALGTTSSTAYRGDYGNAAYTHAVTNKGAAFASGLYKITTNSEGHVIAATAVEKTDITGLGIPSSNTIYSLTQDSSDGHKITLTPSSGTAQTITIPDNNTDTKVTSAANHYTPSRDTSADKSASASGATAAWSIDVVKGVTVQTDGKGHVTGVAVTSGKIPGNPNTDTHRPVQVNGTQILGNDTTALNLKAGSNVSISNSSGTVTIAATDTTYSNATTSAAGLMSAEDKQTINSLRSSHIMFLDEIDLTQANNNISQTVLKYIEWQDSKYNSITGLRVSVENNGKVGSFWQIHNNSGSRHLTKLIGMELDKNNNLTYIISEPTKFVSALGLGSSAYIAAPLFITTSNSSASDALTYGTATTLSTGQLVFVILNEAMVGSTNATLKLGGNDAINIYLTGTTQLKAKYAAGTMLGLVYNGTNLYMINPPVAV